MSSLTRRAMIGLLATGAGLIALGGGSGYVLRGLFATSRNDTGGGMMDEGMMGSATQADMSVYMELFDRHTELSRTVEEIPGGVRATTESDAHELVAQLQAHVVSMYGHLQQGAEVTCMSNSLPTLFRHARGYQRKLTLTAKGVQVTEISSDPTLTAKIREHAQEVSGFVRDGMPAMMRDMMGG